MGVRKGGGTRLKFDKTAQQRFTDLYKRYYKLMYHVAFEVLHNRVTTEDVVHTSCVRVLEHFSQVSAIDSPQTRNFVAIITKRIALTECSRMKREVPADVPTELENFDDLHETPVVAVERRDAQTALLMEIRRLGAEDQDILMLKIRQQIYSRADCTGAEHGCTSRKKRLQRIQAPKICA